MIGLGGAVRVWARAGPTDLRLGFAGLSGLVKRELGRDLITGDLFLFVSRRRHSAKVLRWDGNGLCVYAKRLARGQFAAVWERAQDGVVRLSMAELALFLEGADLRSIPLGSRKKAHKRG